MAITDDDHGDHPRTPTISLWISAREKIAHLAAGRVGGDGGHVLNTADAHAGTGERTESGLGTGARGLGASTTSRTELDVESSDTDLTAARSDVLGSKHGRVRGRLVAVGLDLHAAYSPRQSLDT